MIQDEMYQKEEMSQPIITIEDVQKAGNHLDQTKFIISGTNRSQQYMRQCVLTSISSSMRKE